jgi:hypothetical protein
MPSGQKRQVNAENSQAMAAVLDVTSTWETLGVIGPMIDSRGNVSVLHCMIAQNLGTWPLRLKFEMLPRPPGRDRS